MSLRLKIHLLFTALMLVFVGVLVTMQIDNTRRSVHEEVVAANRVAAQLLTRVSWIYEQAGVPGLADFLQRLGRVRSNDVLLFDNGGALLYRSPPSIYKEGRNAPPWFVDLVAPPLQPLDIQVTGGRMVVQADASRAALDGWDDLLRLLQLGVVFFVVANALVYWLTGQALRPLGSIVEGLEQMERGAYHTRLPPLPGKEARMMSGAFNRMAQAVEESVAAKRAAAEASEQLAENRELTTIIQSRIEEERRAIARELHDELGQSVTAIKSMGLSIAQRAAGRDAAIEQAARMVVDTAGRMYEAVHHMIPRLRPPALDSFGLREALEELVADWRMQHPEAEFVLHVDGLPAKMDDNLATAAYRIAQEAVSNALRHAAPRRVEIDVRRDGTDLLLGIADDGRGLPPGWRQPGHYGVLGMRERAVALGGALELQRPPAGGLRVQARIPLG